MIDVLVVGAGPTGLMLAAELLRRGVETRIVEKAEEPTKLSKAVVVHARTLEILDDAGIASNLIEVGLPLSGATLWDGSGPPSEPPKRVLKASFDELDTRFAYLLCVSQAETEKVLGEWVTSLGGEVERGVELTELEQKEDRVVSTLSGTSREGRVASRYVVGCDGARSTVRKQLGIGFEGSTYDERFLLADVCLGRGSELPIPNDRISAFFGADGLMACFPMRGERFRLIATAPPGDEGEDAPTLEEIRDLFRSRTKLVNSNLTDPAWLARFKIHCRQVSSYRTDRVFLAGDAAHIHSPAGGQGMNTGIQDAHNLAWKLALACRGRATEPLLHSYHAERHAIGQSVLRSTDVATRVGTIRNALARSVRTHLTRFLSSFEFVQQRVVREIAELTVGYERSPIVAGRQDSLLAARLGGDAARDERPTLGAWRRFDAGPKPGTRAPDGHGKTAHGEPRRLFAALDSCRFSVLLFDGRAATEAGYAKFAEIARDLEARFAGIVEVVVVTPAAERPNALPSGIAVLLDADGDLEERYGADAECVYVLRPDRYISFRSQPADGAEVIAHLARIVEPSAVG